VTLAVTPASFDESFSSGISGGWIGSSLPVAASTKLSLVDVSPSTVAPLNETSATSRAIGVSTAAAIGASVATKDSIVAMSG
jgi:hypothetical protein